MSNLVEFSSNNLPRELDQVSSVERESHRDLIVRNIDFLTDILAAESMRSARRLPVGCPSATPVVLARKRNSERSDEKFPCKFKQFTERDSVEEDRCCSDPLCGSDDPLDSVAAVCLASENRTPGERYHDHRWRELVHKLRTEIGSWDQIQSLDNTHLNRKLESLSADSGFHRERGDRLNELLHEVAESEKTEGVSLAELPPVRYDSLADYLSGLTGISESDAWWLLLTAFEKPVWPSTPETDALLCSLGLLTPNEYRKAGYRRGQIEDLFSDRRLPVLHRVLSNHAYHSGGQLCDQKCPSRKFMLPYRIRKQEERSPDSKPTAVDLFAGAGGFSAGMRAAGIDVISAVDQSVTATDTYRLNHPEIPHESIRTEDIDVTVESGFFEEIEEDIDIVVGGPPCQALSIAGYRSRLSNDENYKVLDDPRATLYQSYIDALDDLDPEIVVLENVEGMISEIGDTGVKVSEMVCDGLSDAGYEASVALVDCSGFGLPQSRKRVIIFGVDESSQYSSEDLLQMLMDRKEVSTPNIRQALAGLPRLKRGEGGNVVPYQIPGPRGEFFEKAGLKGDSGYVFNHQARAHPKPKDQKLFDEAMEPGMNSADVIHGTEYGHLIDYDIGTEEDPRFVDKYRMLDWEEPCPTIVAHLKKDANSFIIPDYHEYYEHSSGEPCAERNRGITPREAARIQSFPDDFVFLGAFTDWFQQIGNAVPPYLGRQIGEITADLLARTVSAGVVPERNKSPVESDD